MCEVAESNPGTRSLPAVCVAGCGYWGKNLARNFAEIGCLYAICDSAPANLQALRAQYPQAKAYSSFDEVLADPNVRAVALASPAEKHYAMGSASLRAGKDAFVEKPLALDYQEGIEMVNIARQMNSILM